MCVARVSECELEVDALAVDILQHTSVGELFCGWNFLMPYTGSYITLYTGSYKLPATH